MLGSPRRFQAIWSYHSVCRDTQLWQRPFLNEHVGREETSIGDENRIKNTTAEAVKEQRAKTGRKKAEGATRERGLCGLLPGNNTSFSAEVLRG